MPVKQISLYYKDGGSDKVYHTQIENEANGYVVNFQYGKRGATLATGTKTKSPVDLQTAEKTFYTIVKEKLSKGYTEGESGAVFQSKGLEERITGIVPQLLNVVEEEDLPKYLMNPEWFMQEKFDGQRLLIKKENNEVTAINKKGLSILIPVSVENIVKAISQDIVLDGEIIGEKYYIFDLLELNGKNIRSESAKERYELLSTINELKEYVVETYFTQEGKEKLLKELKDNKKEGAVFKKVSSPYVAGRPASGGNQLKFKFWESATVEVIKQHKTKRSVTVAVYRDGEQQAMGNITIPSNYEIPAVGEIVEVIYLYCHVGGALYQTKYKGVRNDQNVGDCLYSQLKFKAIVDEDE